MESDCVKSWDCKAQVKIEQWPLILDISENYRLLYTENKSNFLLCLTLAVVVLEDDHVQ